MSNLSIGNILIDGNLGDWTAFDRLDFLPGTRVAGYEIYGKYTGDNYVFALKSDGQQIGLNTTFWLNTDANSNTGFKIFGYAGGVEYFVNFNNNGTAVVLVLYQIDANGNTVGNGQVLNFAVNAEGTAVEFAIPSTLLNNTSQKIDILVDVNNNTFLPSDYSSSPYTLETNLPQRTDFSKKVAIVFSETTANNFFDKKAYTQLFMSMQYQAMMAGVPFDILTEDDLTDLNKVVNYDALIFPSFRNVQSSKLDAISDTLAQAVYKYNIGIITAGDFLSNDENGTALAGDSYSRMKQLLDVTRTTGGGPVNGTLRAENIAHPMMDNYTANEAIRSYNNIFFNTYSDGISGDGKNPITLADFEVGGQNYNAILATQTGGRNVHFATESFLGDNNLVWQALQWVMYDNKPTVRLNMSRDASIFLSRNDMDQSQEYFQVNPDDGSQGIYAKMNSIVEQWKNDYNFVGSYYINIGNDIAEGRYTDWSLAKVYYNQLLALGNEIGTHSYTHLLDYAPIANDTNVLTPQQLEFEFNRSKAIIEQQLGIKIVGAAVPGQPEGLYVNEELRKYLPYVTGGYSSVGAGYPGAFGFMFPGDDYVYFAPNMSFDFSLIGFKKLTAAQAELVWEQEYKEITNNAAQPIVLFPWHDYGPTLTEPGYTEAMFTNFIARAYNDNTEFVTFADLYQRIITFEKSQLFLNQNGNTITANVTSNDVGKFGLNIDSNLPIQSVNNWYAYDKDTVFLPKAGGEFTINLGATQDDVTHIIDLPMRGELLSLTGNGSDLAFSFFGEGKVIIDLKAANGDNYLIAGADSKTLNGEILELKFNSVKQHNATVKLVADNPPTVINPIANFSVNEDAANTIIDLSNVFADRDGSAIVKTVLVNSNGQLVTTNLVNNTLTLDYQNDRFGTADITIRGTSNGKTVDDTFTVTVNPIDDAPIVTKAIANLTVNEDAANTIINIGNVFSDVDNDPTAIIKSVTSSNLVKASIVNDNLNLAYQPNGFGTANITVRGTSNNRFVEDTFTVTVNPIDDAPIVANAIANLTVNEDAPNTTINLSNVFNDIDNSTAAITKTVVKNTNPNLLTAKIVNNSLTLDYQKQQFGTTDVTIRGTSNGKTVDDTFTVTVNPKGKITYGTNANNTLNGNAQRDIIYGLGGNDKLDGKESNDNLYGGQGSDQLKGNNNDDFLYGEAGNDNLDGGKGFDVLTGVDRNSTLAGRGEIDVFKGGTDGDRFVLGDATRAYYNDGNNSNLGLFDFAFIDDFSSSQRDVIQLHGNASNYKLTSFAGNTLISLKTSSVDELIAVVDKTNNLNLNSNAFNYVS